MEIAEETVGRGVEEGGRKVSANNFVFQFETDDRRVPKWALKAFYDGGKVFLPAALIGNEKTVFLCLSADGQPLIVERNHVYADVDWLIAETKEASTQQILKKSKQKVIEAVAKELAV